MSKHFTLSLMGVSSVISEVQLSLCRESQITLVLDADLKCLLFCCWTSWRGEKPFSLGVLLSFSLQRVVWKVGDMAGKGLECEAQGREVRRALGVINAWVGGYSSGPAFLVCSPDSCVSHGVLHSSDKSLSVCIHQHHVSNMCVARGDLSYSPLLLFIALLCWNFRCQTIVLIQIKISPEVIRKKVFNNVKLYLYWIFFSHGRWQNRTFLKSKHCGNCDIDSSLVMPTLQVGTMKLMLK